MSLSVSDIEIIKLYVNILLQFSLTMAYEPLFSLFKNCQTNNVLKMGKNISLSEEKKRLFDVKTSIFQELFLQQMKSMFNPI